MASNVAFIALTIVLIAVFGYWFLVVERRTADAPPAPPPAAATPATLDNSQYLANVAAQAPHSPRSEPTAAPAQAAPATQPKAPAAAQPEAPAAPAADAAPIPTLPPEQAAIIAGQQSNSCPAGQKFYPRTGCHAEGSAGPMPGPVGGAK